MKKTLIALIVSLTWMTSVKASQHPNELLGEFTTEMNQLYFQGRLTDGWDHLHPWPASYKRMRERALSDQNLNQADLDVKYKCVKDIFEIAKTISGDNKLCEPINVAETILKSFPNSEYADPRNVLICMRAYARNINLYDSVIHINWLPYVMKQARNTALPQRLRVHFANFYPTCSQQLDKEEYKQKMLDEILSAKTDSK
jgi:hypothetical protein